MSGEEAPGEEPLSEPILVSEEEGEVLRVARALVGISPVGAALEILETPRRSVTLSPDAMEVLEDTLARGLVRELVRRGGHRVVRSPATRARLWDRHAPVALALGQPSMSLLTWLVETQLGVGSRAAPLVLAKSAELTLGDELVYYLGADLLVRARLASAVATPAFARSTLATLGFPLQVPADAPALRCDMFLEGDGAVVVEALSQDLARRVAEIERERSATANVELATRASAAIERGPVTFVRAAIARGRADLGLFLLEGVGAQLERAKERPAALRKSSSSLTLAERQRIAQGASTILEAALEFRAVARAARATGFLDDGYERAQILAEALEPWTSGGFERVETAVRNLSTLDVE